MNNFLCLEVWIGLSGALMTLIGILQEWCGRNTLCQSGLTAVSHNRLRSLLVSTVKLKWNVLISDFFSFPFWAMCIGWKETSLAFFFLSFSYQKCTFLPENSDVKHASANLNSCNSLRKLKLRVKGVGFHEEPFFLFYKFFEKYRSQGKKWTIRILKISDRFSSIGKLIISLHQKVNCLRFKY